MNRWKFRLILTAWLALWIGYTTASVGQPVKKPEEEKYDYSLPLTCALMLAITAGMGGLAGVECLEDEDEKEEKK